MNNEFSLKELYSVFIKTTYPMEINGKRLEEGEVIASFDKIQIANFDEVKQQNAATGGYDNRALVLWDETKGVNFTFTQGVFSKTQLALLTNSQLIERKEKENVTLFKREELESDDLGRIILSNIPVGQIFIYNKNTFDKLLFEQVDEITFDIKEPFRDVVVDYSYNYRSAATELVIGRNLYNGYVALEGRTKIVDDISGRVRTGIIKIPRMKINSSLNLTLGEKVPPVSGTFQATGYPIGERGQKKVMEVLFLEDDIDSDIL